MAIDKSTSLFDEEGAVFGFNFLFSVDFFVSVLSTFFFFLFLDFLFDSSSSISMAPPLRSKPENHPFLLDIGLIVEAISSPYFWVIVDDDSDDLKKEAALTSSVAVIKAKNADAAGNFIVVDVRVMGNVRFKR